MNVYIIIIIVCFLMIKVKFHPHRSISAFHRSSIRTILNFNIPHIIIIICYQTKYNVTASDYHFISCQMRIHKTKQNKFSNQLIRISFGRCICVALDLWKNSWKGWKVSSFSKSLSIMIIIMIIIIIVIISSFTTCFDPYQINRKKRIFLCVGVCLCECMCVCLCVYNKFD